MATKLILESALDQAEVGSEKEIDEGPVKDDADHKKELADLKKRKGTWVLAPQLITERSIAIRDILMSTCKASWYAFSNRAKHVVSPNHVLEYNISCAYKDFWKHELLEILHTSLLQPEGNQHLLPEFRVGEQVIQWHTDMVDRLLEERTKSLASVHLLPPALYYHLMAPAGEVAQQAHQLALRHWSILQEVEEAVNGGASIKPLQLMHWRKNPAMRCLLMAFQQDEDKHQAFTVASAARKRILNFAKNLGDSRLVENIHQHGRDLFRSSKANSISTTSIMSNALKSKVLEGREVPCVSAEEASKVLGPQWNTEWKGSVLRTMRSKGKKVPVEIQKLMMPMKGEHQWPSPSAGSNLPNSGCLSLAFQILARERCRDDGTWCQ